MPARDSDRINTRRYTQQNRRAWNEIATPRRKNSPSPEFFAQGGTWELSERLIQAAGDVRGKRLLHLQCADGAETLSWAVLGAQVTGLDISDVAIEIARDQAERAGLDATFVASDVYEPPVELQQADYDIVYAGGRALLWLPELELWAGIVARALRPGGFLLLEDGHPITGCLRYEDGRWTVTGDYFHRADPEPATGGLKHLVPGSETHETFFCFSWPIGTTVTALIRAGLRIDLLEERPDEVPRRVHAVLGPEAEAALRRVPSIFLLRAICT